MRDSSYSRDGLTTTFVEDDGQVWLSRLFEMTGGRGGHNEGPRRARGLMRVATDTGRFEADDLPCVECRFDDTTAHWVWRTCDQRLSVESHWSFCRETGVWSRRDVLANIADTPVVVRSALARFPFSNGPYDVYSQGSRWCGENQGDWQALDHGAILLTCEGGRTTQGNTPYAVLRERGGEHGVAFHILPRGDWLIRIAAWTLAGDLPMLVVEAGLSDQDLHLSLQPGARLELPEIRLHAVPRGEVHRAAPDFMRYVLRHDFPAAKRCAPVVYNTWFDVFDQIEVGRLGRQLEAARAIGCEVFTVDAGWYGLVFGSWWNQTGDWRENPHAAFRGRMRDFADKVRAAGLGFGIWMEPERFGADVPVRQAHPEWFRRGEGGCYWPDLTQSAAYAHLRAEITRLVETYGLAWIKIDFNFDLGHDPSGAAFAHYYECWYALLDEVRTRHPGTFFEGCTSGGLRSDLATLRHFDGHFLSDTVHPIDTVRIREGAMLRLPVGRINQWLVLRSIGNTVPLYGVPAADTPDRLVTPCGATWDRAETVGLDFAARAAMPGMFGISGDLTSLAEPDRARLGHHVAFVKTWREFITASVAYPLTPPRRKEDREGWAALQLQRPPEPTSLVFAYRLNDGCELRSFPLSHLDPALTYRVRSDDPADPGRLFSGATLLTGGLPVVLPGRHSAAVFLVGPEPCEAQPPVPVQAGR